MSKNDIKDISIHTIEELITKIKLDETRIIPLEEKIEKLEKAQETYIKTSNDKLPKIKNDENKIRNTKENNNSGNTNIKNEVTYYLSLINSILYTEDMENKIKNILPDKDDINYNNLIIAIKSELIKNIKDIKDLINENENQLTKTDLIDFKNEIELNKRKLEIITNLSKTNDTHNNKTINRFIFVPTNNGNIRVIDEIQDIQNANYMNLFKNLFDAIKEGNLKNVKQFNPNQNLESSIWQVKYNDIRIIFDRIGKNEYAIITAFIKTGQNEKLYRDSLVLKINNYFKQKNNLKSNLSNKEFLDLNEMYENELYNLLNRYNKGENAHAIK